MIKITELSFKYSKNSPLLLENINIHIPKGAYVSIVGENGSCKTTLIKLILKLLTPTCGEITLDTPQIAYVPQRVDSFNSEFPITVAEVLKTHGKALKLNTLDAIKKALEAVNMTAYKNKLIGNLSGGQRQRIFIARALMGNPELIILDEPSTGVDIKNQNEIYSILYNLNRNSNKTIISIEHNMDIALKYSTHILTIKEGRVMLQSIDEFKNSTPLRGA